MTAVEAAREKLLAAAAQLEAIRRLLLEVQAALPLPEASAEEEPDPAADPDEASEMHAVIGCSVHDSLDPLIRDLLAAAAYRPAARSRR